MSTTGAGAGIWLTGDFGTNAAGGTNYLVVNTSAGNGPVNLNASFGRGSVWNRLAGVTVNAGTGTITWSGTDATSNNQGPVTLNGGAINISSNLFSNTTHPMAVTLAPTLPSTVSGQLTGTIELVAAGPSTVTLTATNTYTLSTTINGGTLQFGTGQSGQDGALSNSNVYGISNNSTLVYDLFGTQTAAYPIAGSGNVVKTGSGTLVLANAGNSYGNTSVNAGALFLSGGARPASA